MYTTFNMGVGMVLVVPVEQAEQALALANEQGEQAYRIGTVTAGSKVVRSKALSCHDRTKRGIRGEISA